MANLLDTIRDRMGELSKSDRIIANVILLDPALVVNETIGSLSERSNVSEPTISRFCKKFGAQGFPDFKVMISASLQTAPKVDTKASVRSGDSVEGVFNKVIDSTINSLNSLSKSLDLQVVARCIDLISQARRIVIVSQGLSYPTAVDMQLRLLRLGITCEIASDRAMMQVMAASMRHGDLLVSISMTGKSVDVIKTANIAREVGASIIGISPNTSPLCKACQLNLHSGSLDYMQDNIMVDRTVQKVIVQILLAGVMLRRYDTIKEMKDRVDRAYFDVYNKDSLDDNITEDHNGLYNPSAPITTLPH